MHQVGQIETHLVQRRVEAAQRVVVCEAGDLARRAAGLAGRPPRQCRLQVVGCVRPALEAAGV
jgi:hypothetical protein